MYKTILSGDLAGNDIDVNDLSALWDEPSRAENSFHVLFGGGCDQTAVLDGFTITAGNAHGPSYYDKRGGGMYNTVTSSPTVTNCTFRGNLAATYGGGMVNFWDSKPVVTNCTFIGNWAKWYGGGMCNWESSPTVTNCTFSGNLSPELGGGMGNGLNSANLTNCTFSGNLAKGTGGGIHNDSGSPTFTNCTFRGNSATTKGGGMFSFGSNLMLLNCTFSNNSAALGGGMCNVGEGVPILTNCILWGDSPQEVHGGTPTFRVAGQAKVILTLIHYLLSRDIGEINTTLTSLLNLTIQMLSGLRVIIICSRVRHVLIREIRITSRSRMRRIWTAGRV